MVKWIHTGDNHLGAIVGGDRQATYQAFQSLVDQALAHQVDFFIIAGDLIHDQAPSIYTDHFLQSMWDKLGQAHIPVYYARGNHDYNRPSFHHPNVYEYPGPADTHYLTTKQGLQVALSAFSYQGRWNQEAMALNYPHRSPQADLHIGIYHGQVQDGDNSHRAYAPFTISQLQNLGYDYWALGHIHQAQALDSQERIFYCGSSQGLTQKEEGKKGAWLVQWQGRGIPLQKTFLPSAQIIWSSVKLELDRADYSLLSQALQATSWSQAQIVQLEVTVPQAPKSWTKAVEDEWLKLLQAQVTPDQGPVRFIGLEWQETKPLNPLSDSLHGQTLLGLQPQMDQVMHRLGQAFMGQPHLYQVFLDHFQSAQAQDRVLQKAKNWIDQERRGRES